MTTPFNSTFTCTYTLDKAYYTECFEQSVPKKNLLQAYARPILFFAITLIMFNMAELNPYIPWFAFCWTFLEGISVYFQKPWWVTRQMFSKEANTEVTLLINDDGINTSSTHVNNQILWQGINEIIQTAKGFVIVHQAGRTYIRSEGLSDEVCDFLSLINRKDD